MSNKYENKRPLTTKELAEILAVSDGKYEPSDSSSGCEELQEEEIEDAIDRLLKRLQEKHLFEHGRSRLYSLMQQEPTSAKSSPNYAMKLLSFGKQPA
jgi:hypothetical protein